MNYPDFLIASHIKPWVKSEGLERLDVDNGFLFCPTHDSLFDKGYISFNDGGEIMIAKDLDEANRSYLNVQPGMRVILTEGNKKYLCFHRDYIFLNSTQRKQ